MTNLLEAFIAKQIGQTGKKSTVMTPLVMLGGILAVTFVAAFQAKAPFWATSFLGGALGLCVLAFLIIYVVLLCRNPDLLRSEEFKLTEMVIQKGLLGDSSMGLLETTIFSTSGIGAPGLPASETQEHD